MTSDNSSVLHVDKLSVGYGKIRVVHDVSFDVRSGEIFGLIGLNGAGKTSIIKTLIGLREPESGAATILGGRADDPRVRQSLAYLPERFDPPWFLTGFEFLRFSLRLYNRPYDESSVLSAISDLALDPKALRRRVQVLSKGMRQKLGLLGTILTGAPFLVLDEPMSGLDPLARVRVKESLMSCRAQGRTLFLSSHILSDMAELCDRVAILHDGRLIFCGIPSALLLQEGVSNLEQAFLSVIGASPARLSA